MSTLGGASLSSLLATPLTVPAPVAGVLAVLFVVLVALAVRHGGAGGMRRLVLPVTAILLVCLAAVFLADRLATNEQGAERRALAQRDAELTAQALAPGSALACLDDTAGDTVENGCEKAIFADPQSTARAVAYIAGRLTLLVDAFAGAPGGDLRERFSGMRRTIELDRFGIVAHVLAVRDGCTAGHCAVFALLDDANVLKSNLKAQIFDQYVARHTGEWDKSAPVAEARPATPSSMPVAGAAEPPPTGKPVDSRYDFPSASTIPPVSIMNAEPALPKAPADNSAAPSAAVPSAADGGAPEARLPLPPKRPQVEAAAPPAR